MNLMMLIEPDFLIFHARAHHCNYAQFYAQEIK